MVACGDDAARRGAESGEGVVSEAVSGVWGQVDRWAWNGTGGGYGGIGPGIKGEEEVLF